MKAIFVTGAASGIGRATALLFSRRGFKVGCYDVDVEGARRVAEEIDAGAGKGTSRHGRIDVTNEESWTSALEDFEAHAHRLDVLFNCAGVLRTGRFEDVSPTECRRQLDVNVMGVVLGVQKSLPLLERTAAEHGESVIVNMSSASATYGQPELAVYSATKFAVRALTEALDVELAGRKIRVCDVMPSYVDTPMVASQTHTPKSLARLGVNLTAEGVAETVWKAAHGRGLHYIPQVNVALMDRLGGLLPELGRVVTRQIAKR
ncbi:MAG: SDR family oxidoreductase [Labilithrix sp.]|nr:SDR family oxidoreductase [Labilithrix sp.]MCW5834916.1 SDR family oxidoreductase [Labilithrix sp.]